MSVIHPGDTVIQDPDAELLWEMDWSDWLPPNEYISAHDWSFVGSDSTLTLTEQTLNPQPVISRCLIKGGTLGVTYFVTSAITLPSTPSQKDRRSFWLRIEKR